MIIEQRENGFMFFQLGTFYTRWNALGAAVIIIEEYFEELELIGIKQTTDNRYFPLFKIKTK